MSRDLFDRKKKTEAPAHARLTIVVVFEDENDDFSVYYIMKSVVTICS